MQTRDKDLGSLLDRIGAIREACDLDLLLFFHRHPRALLTGEQLASSLGYGYDGVRIENSTEALIAAGFLTRSQHPPHATRLYVLELGGAPGGLVSSLATIAATREGRQDAMRRLESGPGRAPGAGIQPHALPAEQRVA